MIQFSQEQLTALDQLIKKNLPFVIYKMPHQVTWHFIMQTHTQVEEFTDLSSLNGRSGYVIAPFESTTACPILLLTPDRDTIPSLKELEGLESLNSTEVDQERVVTDPMFNSYSSSFETFMAPLRRGEAEKLVLSRRDVIEREEGMSLGKAFEQACLTNPNAYVYLLHTNRTGTWLGSSPEVIISGNKSKWQTVALAGTKPIICGVQQPWDTKNKLEQAFVADYVKHQLQKFGANPQVTGPIDISAGKVTHLVSHFNFELEDRSKLGDLLHLLHPTPAVCGTPKAYAFRFITQEEPQSRKYYSGFIGVLNPEGQTNLYVNLRCMQISKKYCTLYAGGGLLLTSKLEEEWNETENKMQTMKALLGAKKIS